VRRRWLDQENGRWTASDPIIFTANNYAYVWGLPTRLLDPSGTLPDWQTFWDYCEIAGAFKDGLLYRGPQNIAIGVADTAVETYQQGAEVVVGVYELSTGIRCADQSPIGRAIISGDVGLVEYYCNYGNDLIHLGTRGQMEAAAQYIRGEIDANEASSRIGSAALLQGCAAGVGGKSGGMWTRDFHQRGCRIPLSASDLRRFMAREDFRPCIERALRSPGRCFEAAQCDGKFEVRGAGGKAKVTSLICPSTPPLRFQHPFNCAMVKAIESVSRPGEVVFVTNGGILVDELSVLGFPFTRVNYLPRCGNCAMTLLANDDLPIVIGPRPPLTCNIGRNVAPAHIAGGLPVGGEIRE